VNFLLLRMYNINFTCRFSIVYRWSNLPSIFVAGGATESQYLLMVEFFLCYGSNLSLRFVAGGATYKRDICVAGMKNVR
jgi:hypothetical protein